ncbi:uncharacterized protein LOC133517315 isoform X1 [Cydia pomonella]|uniref:uncharacterized protein LOC133517315 isoform X1 n=1 Tax=Cydia pomonella TaxID=82600 RepID=UPI002ADDDC8F|nr:uncharacterized protein LOC133517315 isoform X1 [Cydia pomonella]XP_061706556.1 uncharacterized protein LOC133517315 isoform X1 [Cydia pomonella]XP_061706557.1 uncharacterized protein LOC133517315 isoform X1 [Cydia pomonella]
MKAWTATEQDTSLPCCRTLHIKHAAYASALYTLNISILVVLLYSWRIGVNAKRYKELDDVYYGVQIAYFAIIGTQMFMIMLSIILFYGIYKENVAFLVPWVVGCMTFMALEAMAMVYSNILRDHVNRVSISEKSFFFKIRTSTLTTSFTWSQLNSNAQQGLSQLKCSSSRCALSARLRNRLNFQTVIMYLAQNLFISIFLEKPLF